MSILKQTRVKKLIPQGALMDADSWETLDKELDQLVKQALIFSQRKAGERQRKTISTEDIKNGLNEYCESYSLNYLLMFKDQMNKTVQDYFDKKINEVKENASRRLLYAETNQQ